MAGASMMMMMFLLVVLTTCAATYGEVYKVGDNSGWTIIGKPDYKAWAASKSFHVGDTLLFEYNKQYHNVLRVTHKNYNACNSTDPIATWDTGKDSFTIKRPGHYFFICGVPGHCEGGQKVAVRASSDAGLGPSPSQSESPAPSPSAHKKSGATSLSSSLSLWAVLVAVTGFVAIAY